MLYAIYKTDNDQLFWNTELGWVETELETRFTLNQRNTVALPLGGVWCEIHE